MRLRSAGLTWVVLDAGILVTCFQPVHEGDVFLAEGWDTKLEIVGERKDSEGDLGVVEVEAVEVRVQLGCHATRVERRDTWPGSVQDFDELPR